MLLPVTLPYALAVLIEAALAVGRNAGLVFPSISATMALLLPLAGSFLSSKLASRLH